jgi:hypothetical protein
MYWYELMEIMCMDNIEYTRVNITMPKELRIRYDLYKSEREETIELSSWMSKQLDDFLTKKGYPKVIKSSSQENRELLQKGQNKEQLTKICDYCGSEFKTNNPKAKFCKDACKSADYRKRKVLKG